MKYLKAFLFLLFSILLSSCNLSKKVNSTSFASYQKLQIAQQANIKKQNDTTHKRTQIENYGTTSKEHTETASKTTTPPLQLSAHKPAVKNIAAKVVSSGTKSAIYAKGPKNVLYSTVKNAELAGQTALWFLGIGSCLGVIGFFIVIANLFTGALNVLALGFILFIIGCIFFGAGLLILLVLLIRRMRKTSRHSLRKALIGMGIGVLLYIIGGFIYSVWAFGTIFLFAGLLIFVLSFILLIILLIIKLFSAL